MFFSQNDGYFRKLLKGDNSHLPAGKRVIKCKIIMPCSANKLIEPESAFMHHSRAIKILS